MPGKAGLVYNFYGAEILKDGRMKTQSLWVRDGEFINPETVNFQADVSLDISGCLVSPGFIDLKLQGAFGINFGDVDPTKMDDALLEVSAKLVSTGVTLYCPTLQTAHYTQFKSLIPAITVSECRPEYGAGVLGVHLDGPIFSISGPGHPEEQLVNNLNGSETLETVYGEHLENVKIITLAPELPGAMEIIPLMKNADIIVSIGHSKATLDEAENAVRKGVSMITHLFNAMPSYHHRDPGIVGLLVSQEVEDENGIGIAFTIISDCNHVHPAALRMAYRMGKQHLMLITDGLSPLGLDPQTKALPCTERFKAAQKGRVLAGSFCPMNQAIKNLTEVTGCSLSYALEAASTRQARVMGLYPRKGSLNVGADADFVLISPDTFDVLACFIKGQKVVDTGHFSDLKQLNNPLEKAIWAQGKSKRRKFEKSISEGE